MATAVDVLAQVVAVLNIDVGYDIVHELSLRQGCLGQRTMSSAYGEFIEAVTSFRDCSAPGVVLMIERESDEGRGDAAEEQTLLDVAVIIVDGGEVLMLPTEDSLVAVPTCLELVGAETKKCQE